MVVRPTRLSALSTCALAMGGTATGIAHAQDTAGEPEEIVVTGSFITRPVDRPQPVVVLGQDDIQARQRVSVGEVMRDMPQITSVNTNGTSGAVLRSATGSNSINIRGLGDRSTLILLNGQRQTVDANAASVVDVNSLTPTLMLERVEMVLDGSSALYGSDAVAAVVNFVTRDSFEGAAINISTQHAEAQTDAPEVLIGGIIGTQGERAGVVLSFEWTERQKDLLLSDVFSPEIIDRQGTHSAFGNPGTYIGIADSRTRPDPLCGSPLVGGRPELLSQNPAGSLEGNFCRQNLATMRTLEPRSERLTGMAVGTLRFENDWLDTLRLETSFSKDERKRAFSTGSPVSSLDIIGATVPATNPGVIDAAARDPNFPIQEYRLNYRSPYAPIEGYVEQGNEQFTYRVASGLNGYFGNQGRWDWRINASFSQNDTVSENPETIADRFNLALNGFGGPDCNFNSVNGAANDPNVQPGVGPCMYYNPFISRALAQPGDPTYVDPTLVEWFTTQEREIGEAALTTLEAITTGELFELPGGTTSIAVGTQWRRQTLDIIADAIGRDGGFASDPQPLISWDAKRTTNAMFAEMVMYPTDTFELDLAARWEETGSQGSTEPKVSALWKPTDRLFVRGSWGRSFRVPSEVAAFGVTGEGGRGTLIIGGEFPQAEGYTVGNPDLAPEKSENISAGITWDATDSLTLGVSYWSYEFTDLIARTSANEFLQADLADGFLDDTVHHPLFIGAPNEVCEVTGRWDPASGDPLPAGCVTSLDIRSFNTFWVNQDRLETSGYDFELDYNAELPRFELRTRLAATYVSSLKGVDVATGELKEAAGTDGFGIIGVSDNRRWRANLAQEARFGNHSLRLTGRYVHGYRRTNPNASALLSSDASFIQWDLLYRRDFPTSTLSVAVVNVADKHPPLTTGSLIFNPTLYDGRGRLFRLGLQWDF